MSTTTPEGSEDLSDPGPSAGSRSISNRQSQGEADLYFKAEKRKLQFRTATFTTGMLVALAFFCMLLYMAGKGVSFYGTQVERDSNPPVVTVSKATKSDTQTTAKGIMASAEAKPPAATPAPAAQAESTTNGMTHYVLMMTLIGAIGITVFISLTKFAFARESNTTGSGSSGLQMPTTPILQALQESLSILADIVKKDK